MTVPSEPVPVPGRCCGHVDLGDLGVADRWADLAVAMLSLSWNYAGSWEDDLLDGYGVELDATRVDYYQQSPASGRCPHWTPGDISSH